MTMKKDSNNQKTESYIAQLERVVHVDVEGTLEEKLGLDYKSIRRLTISGNINEDDFRLVGDIYGLEYLNLELAFYILDDKEIDETDSNKIELPYYILEGLGNLESLFLPSNITHITHISNFNISDCWSLLSVVIPKSVCSFSDINYPNVLSDCDSLQDIKVSSENMFFADIDGILTNKDKTILKCYPPGRTDECVVIPDGVKEIGQFAFYGSESITSIVIPDSVTTIDKGAFTNCYNIDNIIISPEHPFFLLVDGILMNKQQTELIYCIGKYVKSDIVLPDSITSITSIPNSFFSYCKNIISIKISNSITTIGAYAFYECVKLSSVKMSDNVVILGNSVFEWCESLTSIVIPNGVTCIGDCAFMHCESLTTVEIPDSVKSIGYDAFSCCKSLTSVIIPDSVTIISQGTFESCENLENIKMSDSVTTIEGSAFAYCENLKSIVIPKSVTTIGRYAFFCCHSLTSIEIPDSVTTIEQEAFSVCESLDNIIISPDHPYFLYVDGILMNKQRTEIIVCIDKYVKSDVDLPDSITDIPNYFFHNCYNISSIIIPNSVTAICSDAFYGCRSLISIVIPNSVTTIGKKAFHGCRSLTSIEIPNSVTTIGRKAFHGCHSLTSIEIPNSVTTIEQEAFSVCENLDNIIISHDHPCFLYVDGILMNKQRTEIIVCIDKYVKSDVDLPDSITDIPYSCFYNCENIISIRIPNSVFCIYSDAFYGCKSLTSIEIPNSVMVIGDRVFSGCERLEFVSFGAGIHYIGEHCFVNCDNLQDIFIHAETPPTLASQSNEINNITIHVPADSLDEYKTHPDWQGFKEYVSIC